MSTLIFVHIDKAGDTYLRRLLLLKERIPSFDCFHNGSLLHFEDGCCVRTDRVELNSLECYDTAVVALMHPLTRLQGCYDYFLSGGLNNRGKGEFSVDRQYCELVKSIAPTFSSCCQNLSLISSQIPHFIPASFWWGSLDKTPAKNLICCRQESFDDDVNGLFRSLNLPLLIPSEHRNKTAESQSLDVNISSNDLRLVEQFYSSDFSGFGYESRFPKSLALVQYRDQKDPPDLLAERMEACKNLNPAWAYRRFSKQSAAEFLASSYGSDVAAAFLDIRIPAMQADVFRVGFLLHSGGLWVDSATSLLRPVESWLDRRHSFQMLRRSHQVHPKIATQLIFAARPRLPLLQAVWDEMVPRLLARSGTKVYRHFGPGLFRDLMASRPNLALSLHVITEDSLHHLLKLGSSSNVLPSEQHWTKRQVSESLYLSGK